jgi:hypothetical protein
MIGGLRSPQQANGMKSSNSFVKQPTLKDKIKKYRYIFLEKNNKKT